MEATNMTGTPGNEKNSFKLRKPIWRRYNKQIYYIFPPIENVLRSTKCICIFRDKELSKLAYIALSILFKIHLHGNVLDVIYIEQKYL